jgi:hypothetical protein
MSAVPMAVDEGKTMLQSIPVRSLIEIDQYQRKLKNRAGNRISPPKRSKSTRAKRAQPREVEPNRTAKKQKRGGEQKKIMMDELRGEEQKIARNKKRRPHNVPEPEYNEDNEEYYDEGEYVEADEYAEENVPEEPYYEEEYNEEPRRKPKHHHRKPQPFER